MAFWTQMVQLVWANCRGCAGTGRTGFRYSRLTASMVLGTVLVHGAGAVVLAEPEPPIRDVQLAQRQPQAATVLGVVRSPENQSYWRDIESRLNAAGLPYRTINWEQVQRSSTFGEVTVLFLPNVETITAEQLLRLQAWLNRGGRLIVSGPVGRASSSGVQHTLRSLIGAYWDSALAQPQPPQPLSLASQPWVQAAPSTIAVAGGVMVPTSLSSQPVAVWGASSDAAVIVTPRSTVLGWRWGTAEAEFDSRWLQAAVSRFQPRSSAASAAVSSVPAASVSTTAAPATPPAASAAPAPSTSPRLLPMPRPPVPVAGLPSTEPVAPPPIDHLWRRRLTLHEATTMQQELENLLGRYESALIFASAEASDLAAGAAASATTVATRSAKTAELDLDTDAVLLQARQGLAAFSQALAQRDYPTARQQWLQTRQLLWDNFPLDRSLAQPEIRAMWLDRGTIVQAGSRQGLARIFDRLAAAGINTVFFETVNAGYPIYPSRVAPQQNPLTRQWDPLQAAVELAHERGMELHAWVWTFAAGNQVHNRLLNLPDSYPGPVLAAHPDWASYDDRGNLIPPGQTKPFYDPAHPEVRRYLLRLFEEIITRYDVDGLQLDYIRYPFQDPRQGGHTHGYGRAARQQFQQLTGIDPITLSPGGTPAQRQQWQQWTEFRIQQVSSFVAETSRLVRRLRPELILSTAVFALPEQQRLQEIQQHWEVWARHGDIDLVVLMSYANDTNGLQRLAGSWLSGEIELGSALVLPGIRLLNLSHQSVMDQIQSLRNSSAGGFALFAAENLDSGLQTILSQTQGARPTAEPIPYRQPFATAVRRFAVLQRQWNWLLSTGRWSLSEQQQQDWQSQMSTVVEALQMLEDQPSEQTLAEARTQLHQVRSQLHRWISLPDLNQDYQLRTWDNQLIALENLLHYGEQVVLLRTERPSAAVSPSPLP
ncbi:MAG: family 10 glycosylhydrolase [Synechococcales cyanobacterium C42_A2020_086]|nr:family 10 glycosylhydrolase [Synechococcales cyanobacterium C42_A2020_086]